MTIERIVVTDAEDLHARIMGSDQPPITLASIDARQKAMEADPASFGFEYREGFAYAVDLCRQEIERLTLACVGLEHDWSAAVADGERDRERLDWLEAQSNGMLWIARQSSTGRGYRLHNDPHIGEHETAREAIDKAMSEAATTKG